MCQPLQLRPLHCRVLPLLPVCFRAHIRMFILFFLLLHRLCGFCGRGGGGRGLTCVKRVSARARTSSCRCSCTACAILEPLDDRAYFPFIGVGRPLLPECGGGRQASVQTAWNSTTACGRDPTALFEPVKPQGSTSPPPKSGGVLRRFCRPKPKP